MLPGGTVFLYNRGADVIGRYAIFWKTVILIVFEGFTSILLFVGFSLPVVTVSD